MSGKNILSPLRFGIDNTRTLGGKAIGAANSVLKPIKDSEGIDDLMVLYQIPGSAKKVVCELAEQAEIPGLMEFNTARLLWLNRKHHSQAEDPDPEGDYVFHTIRIMQEIGIPQERVGDLIDSDMPRAVIDQSL